MKQNYKPPRIPHSPTRLHLLKVLQPSQRTLHAGDQVFNHTSSWGRFNIVMFVIKEQATFTGSQNGTLPQTAPICPTSSILLSKRWCSSQVVQPLYSTQNHQPCGGSTHSNLYCPTAINQPAGKFTSD